MLAQVILDSVIAVLAAFGLVTLYWCLIGTLFFGGKRRSNIVAVLPAATQRSVSDAILKVHWLRKNLLRDVAIIVLEDRDGSCRGENDLASLTCGCEFSRCGSDELQSVIRNLTETKRC